MLQEGRDYVEKGFWLHAFRCCAGTRANGKANVTGQKARANFVLDGTKLENVNTYALHGPVATPDTII